MQLSDTHRHETIPPEVNSVDLRSTSEILGYLHKEFPEFKNDESLNDPKKNSLSFDVILHDMLTEYDSVDIRFGNGHHTDSYDQFRSPVSSIVADHPDFTDREVQILKYVPLANDFFESYKKSHKPTPECVDAASKMLVLYKRYIDEELEQVRDFMGRLNTEDNYGTNELELYQKISYMAAKGQKAKHGEAKLVRAELFLSQLALKNKGVN